MKVYELIAKSMRPRGFAISQPVKTCVDSTGAALLALRQESGAEKPPCWVIDVFLTADGRKIKTLPLPMPWQSENAPTVDILQLYGVDFLVVVDADRREVHGWRFKLQTAEQVCSMEQLGVGAGPDSNKPGSGAESCFDILYQVLSKFTSCPALASGDASQQVQSTRLTILGPGVDATEKLSTDMQGYISELLRKLQQDTQKPALDSLKLDPWRQGLFLPHLAPVVWLPYSVAHAKLGPATLDWNK